MADRSVSLSGAWKIIKDTENNGKEIGWQYGIPDTEVFDAFVPASLAPEQWIMNLSYSNVFPGYHGFVWYYKTLDTLPRVGEGERCLLEFDHAGHLCRIYVNGIFIGEHRGHEKRFYFDITDALKGDGSDLLAVNCFEPRATGRPIEGIMLSDLPNACWANTQGFMAGAENSFCLECVGGILGEVRLRSAGDITIEDVYIRPDHKSGDVKVKLEVINASSDTRLENVGFVISDQKRGIPVTELSKVVKIPSGSSEVTLECNVPCHKLWSVSDPYLYVANISLGSGEKCTLRFGFKDFRVKNGYFFLNDKRIFLKGAHSLVSAEACITMKALGFNAIRTISRSFTEEALNVCDEIGMLVIDAALTGWGMFMHDNTRSQIEEYNENTIRAHRNHPCIAAYGIFNELGGKRDVFECGVEALPKLRVLAPDTVFFLHSGRWDRDITLGSVSNPGSDRWDTYFGAEGCPDHPDRELPMHFDGYQDPAMGDIHIYMHVPVTGRVKNYLRNIGRDTNPVFVSESGIASQNDPMRDLLIHSGLKLSEAVTVETVRSTLEEAEAFLDFYGLRSVYPLIHDLSRDTDKLNGAQRSMLYDIYRSNPKINGFSFTSFGISNEGTNENNWLVKESLAYALQNGHAPLRWALFSEERTVYADKPFTVEAVLCNEDVLDPGTYKALAYIKGKNGVVWEKSFDAVYPEKGFGSMMPLAARVLKENVSLPAGEYVFTVRLLEGGMACGGELSVTVAKADDFKGDIYVWGISDKMRSFIEAKGISVHDLSEIQNEDSVCTVLVGCPENGEYISLLRTIAEKGASVIFTDFHYLLKEKELLCSIAGEGTAIADAMGTIYHYDHIAACPDVFDGIQNIGVLDFDRYGEVYPQQVIKPYKKPDKTLCAGIRIETTFCYTGLSLGEYSAGKGRFVVNTFRIEETLGQHPFADKLLMNLIKKYN
ncbi:MAG: hypothetical protein E7665_04470 [Ruminococcaceae bacterium]|nr:hypothetical protein [Oscillospiraceae bacterium]